MPAAAAQSASIHRRTFQHPIEFAPFEPDGNATINGRLVFHQDSGLPVTIPARRPADIALAGQTNALGDTGRNLTPLDACFLVNPHRLEPPRRHGASALQHIASATGFTGRRLT